MLNVSNILNFFFIVNSHFLAKIIFLNIKFLKSFKTKAKIYLNRNFHYFLQNLKKEIFDDLNTYCWNQDYQATMAFLSQ